MFAEMIKRFNSMYRLPVHRVPTLTGLTRPDGELQLPSERLKQFLSIIRKEITEGDELLSKMKEFEMKYSPNDPGMLPSDCPAALEILTDLADWLGDIQVYAASEMAKYGLPHTEVMRTIMESNFSKLGADGNPIYDSEGKVQKGPGYWKPEPAISYILKSLQIPGIAIPTNGTLGLQEAAALMAVHKERIAE